MYDEILESQIRFKEEILKQYLRIAKASGKGMGTEKVIDRLLEELRELYRLREK